MSSSPFGARARLITVVLALLSALLQSPGLVVADTKYDLVANPAGFLHRAAHLWTAQAPLGQIQNQAYGYYFPHGLFFLLGDAAHLPPWIVQRLWWALLLFLGAWGMIRLLEALRIGSRPSRVVAAVLYAGAPRVLTTMGSISSETLPVMLAPWVLLPVVLAFDKSDVRHRDLATYALLSGIAVAGMGAVNAVATVLAVAPALVWWIAHIRSPRWWRFSLWWALAGALATVWWLGALLLMGRVSPEFLDYIESAAVTTRWTSLVEVLRGTSSWTPFVSPERAAGESLVTQPVFVLATAGVAAAGLAGLIRTVHRRRFAAMLAVGLVLLGAGYGGALGSPVADGVQHLLDGPLSPLRNVHKAEPLVRLPLLCGLAALLERLPLPGAAPRAEMRAAATHPERRPAAALGAVIVLLGVTAVAPAWTGRLAPAGAHQEVPSYWQETAQWLADHAGHTGDVTNGRPAARALVVPGAPFADHTWGLTRDEPLQALAEGPWAVRDAIPLVSGEAIRSMDTVQRALAEGRPSSALASTLAAQGIGYLVVRNDLNPLSSRSAPPILVRRALENSPGLTRVTSLGPEVGPETEWDDGVPTVAYSGLYPQLPAIDLWQVTPPHKDSLPHPDTGPVVAGWPQVPRITGGPEAVPRLREAAAALGHTVPDLAVLSPQALAGQLDDRGRGTIITDSPARRETDYGSVDHNASGTRTEGDERRTGNARADYSAAGADPVTLRWYGARVTASSSASDAGQVGGVDPGRGPEAAVDGDPSTAWTSGGIDSAVGQWLSFDLDRPLTSGTLRVRLAEEQVGPAVTTVRVTTAAGTSTARADNDHRTEIVLPPGATDWIRLDAVGTTDGTRGLQFSVAEASLTSERGDVPMGAERVLPRLSPGSVVDGWILGQDFPGATRCADTPEGTRCDPALASPSEESGTFRRVIDVPAETRLAANLILRPTGAREQGTAWTAPAEDDSPSLHLSLDHPTEVAAVRITAPTGLAPARVTEVGIDRGTDRTVARLPEAETADPITDPAPVSTVKLDPVVTDSVVLSLRDWSTVRDRSALGLTTPVPPGVAKVELLDSSGAVVGSSGMGRRDDVTLSCAEGPTVTLGKHTIHYSMSASAADVAAGRPVVARPCDLGAAAHALDAGQQRVTAVPPEGFVVDQVVLDTGQLFSSSGQAQPVTVTRWEDTDRALELPAADEQRVLSVPETANPGWEAQLGGRSLEAVTVDGWRQGWLVPAGAGGEVTLTFPLDRAYRWSLGGGLALLGVLGAATLGALALRRRPGGAFLPARRRAQACTEAAGGRRIASVAGVALTGLLAGPTGLVLGIVAVLGMTSLRRRWGTLRARRLGGAAAALSLAGAGAFLAHTPWGHGTAAYATVQGPAQFFAAAAVTVTFAAAWPLPSGRSLAVLRRVASRRDS